MYPSKLECSYRRSYPDQTSSQWEDCNQRREKRHESHRETPRDSYSQYPGSGHSGKNRSSRSIEYGDYSPRRHSHDSLSRDRCRGSPVRRRAPSPATEAKRWSYTEQSDRDYRPRLESVEGKGRKPLLDGFSDSHRTTDFKYASSHDNEDRYSRISFDSYDGDRHEVPKTRVDEPSDRNFSSSYKERENLKRRREGSQDRGSSPDRSAKVHYNTREWKDNPIPHGQDQYHHRGGFPMNGSNEQPSAGGDSSKRAAASDQNSSVGFQRFLEILNQGVNVDVLTKIVTQPGAEVSSNAFGTTVDPPGAEERKQEPGGNRSWNKTLHTQTPPQPCHSPNRSSYSAEKVSPWRERGDGLPGRVSRSPVVEKTLSPEEEQKQKQMQGVLQAIGINLGFEELGQMSNRIQERLYGKKDEDDGRKTSGERSTRPAYAPIRRNPSRSRSRSHSWSSSRSSFSSPTRHPNTKNDSRCSLGDDMDLHRPHYTDSHKDRYEDSRANSDKSNIFSPSSSFPVSWPLLPQHNDSHQHWYKDSRANLDWLKEFHPCPPYPVTRPHPPTPRPPLPLRKCLLPTPPLPSPHLLSAPPQAQPGLFLPPFRPVFNSPAMQSPHTFTHTLPQTRFIFPEHLKPVPQPSPHLVQVVIRPQKAKPQARPRCLQVIK